MGDEAWQLEVRISFLKLKFEVFHALSMTARKRFYKEASIVHNGSSGEYEICLDHRKLKTPLGHEFKIDHEGLAHAVAEEWRMQKELIMTSQMHLTGLCNVCIDNPTAVGKLDLAESTLNFLETDTVLFFADVNL